MRTLFVGTAKYNKCTVLYIFAFKILEVSMSKRTLFDSLFKVSFLALAVLILLCGIYMSFNDHTYIVTVTDKERVTRTADGQVDSYYLIFCRDQEGNYYEFKNADNVLRLKFRSSTVYNQLEVGQKYRFTVVGLRVGFLSWYENIIQFEKIK